MQWCDWNGKTKTVFFVISFYLSRIFCGDTDLLFCDTIQDEKHQLTGFVARRLRCIYFTLLTGKLIQLTRKWKPPSVIQKYFVKRRYCLVVSVFNRCRKYWFVFFLLCFANNFSARSQSLFDSVNAREFFVLYTHANRCYAHMHTRAGRIRWPRRRQEQFLAYILLNISIRSFGTHAICKQYHTRSLSFSGSIGNCNGNALTYRSHCDSDVL